MESRLFELVQCHALHRTDIFADQLATDRIVDHPHEVYVESQNSFRLRGRTATLAGRPDLIVARSHDSLIVDVKVGREQPWHVVQIMIYMYALPRALPQYQGARFAGEVVYPDRTVQVPRGCLHTGFIKDLESLIRRFAANQSSRQLPSEQECRFCDITATDCPERFDSHFQPDDGATTDF